MFDLLLGRSVLYGQSTQEPLQSLLTAATDGGQTACAALRLLNVHYLVVEKDVDRSLVNGLPGWMGLSPNEGGKLKGSTPCLSLSASTGPLMVFDVKTWVSLDVFAARIAPGGRSGWGGLIAVHPVTYVRSARGLNIAGESLAGQKWLFINHPYDPYWRVLGKGEIPVDKAGLTAFRIPQSWVAGGDITIQNSAAKTETELLIGACIILGLCVILTIGGRKAFAGRPRNEDFEG
ncbi:MAG: hypothetical protein ACYCXA_09555 [Actinomycetes bacterium]